MIVTVTMNPAVDKTVEIERLLPGGLNRIRKVEYDAGGKGINVSKTIQKFGGSSVATGFLGGNTGKTIENVLKNQKISCDFVWVDGETRTNTKVFEKNGAVTELNEPGPVIVDARLLELLEKLDRLSGPETLFVLAGSVPVGVDKHIYGDIIRLVKKKGGKVLLDADGELFRYGLEAGPDMIKPNRVELEEYAGFQREASEKELLKFARRLLDRGMEAAAVSMGKDGALLVFPGRQVKCPALSVKAHSTVGAGDAMVAALAFARDKGMETEETIRLCMAAGAGAVTTVGTKPPSRELVRKLMEQVEISDI